MENQLQNGNRVWEDLLSELFRLNYEQQSRITAVEQKNLCGAEQGAPAAGRVNNPDVCPYYAGQQLQSQIHGS